MKHEPFHSKYAPNLTIVEERHGSVTLFPHTEQLPVIARSVKLDLAGILPERLAATDHRAAPYRKLQLDAALDLYCVYNNMSRRDIRLCTWHTPDLVTHVGILQEIITHKPAENVHRFRVFGETEFVPDIHLLGKRIAFKSHVFERFEDRISQTLTSRLLEVLNALFASPAIVMEADGSPAGVLFSSDVLLAFPFEESADEFLFLSSLTAMQINRLVPVAAPRVLDFHYGPTYLPPAVQREWNIEYQQQRLFDAWLDRRVKEPLPPPPRDLTKSTKEWHLLVQHTDKFLAECGRGPDSWMEFRDGIWGPGISTFDMVEETEADDVTKLLEPDRRPPPVQLPPSARRPAGKPPKSP